jgi:D-beta-D-heptose 7-phosphate kinase/D-beta-D-heptose 1-phosphate adenosyltransferase
MRIVLATGGFDPIHSGHILYLKAARELGDKLVVGLNSDAWLTRKKGRPFMPFNERKYILENMSLVDQVIDFNDDDNSACQAIFQILKDKKPQDTVIFANGGDRGRENIPEYIVYSGASPVKFKFGVGGDDKANSSSWILEEWRAPKTERTWGYYRVIHEVDSHTKVKELTVNPGKTLSMQKHNDRSEHWFIAEGTATVYTLNSSTDVDLLGKFTQHQSLFISKQQWHMLANETNNPLKIIEIQFGQRCVEEDIIRKEN